MEHNTTCGNESSRGEAFIKVDDMASANGSNATCGTDLLFNQPTWWRVCQTAIIAAVSVSIVLGNLVNLVVLSRVQQMPWAIRCFLLNLSVSDLCVGLIACLPAIYPSIVGDWPYGDAFCQVSGVVHGSSVTISIWCISMVGFERYVAAVRPYKYHAWVNDRRCFTTVALMWPAAIITFLAPNIIAKDFVYYHYDHAQKICGLQWEQPAYCIITGLYIPVLSGVSLLFTSISIHRVLNRSTTGFRTSRSRETRPSVNRRTLRILVATAVTYFVCWGPYVCLVMVASIWCDVRTPQWVQFMALWVANSNSAVNVFIYSATNKHFRYSARCLLQQITCRDVDKLSSLSLMADSRALNEISKDYRTSPDKN
ncbi:hypothetical protein CAPTEDRAFT_220093 [Capitella teleta]|uniref:G-protein coupled receptors family 1 profile domain-containing protein n=1 Tax=Capitella teleta TaxID=283909 RepID=R7UP16_CAPTE|nr:hypothetical protein CAPTEDRAFT_220093 [Capitella teleta]|eukprot:ELU08274.1 hypothetical protein CAPTEDRAFT_220093 [Capitella teleta]